VVQRDCGSSAFVGGRLIAGRSVNAISMKITI
jgi:hypothetical protein